MRSAHIGRRGRGERGKIKRFSIYDNEQRGRIWTRRESHIVDLTYYYAALIFSCAAHKERTSRRSCNITYKTATCLFESATVSTFPLERFFLSSVTDLFFFFFCRVDIVTHLIRKINRKKIDAHKTAQRIGNRRVNCDILCPQLCISHSINYTLQRNIYWNVFISEYINRYITTGILLPVNNGDWNYPGNAI